MAERASVPAPVDPRAMPIRALDRLMAMPPACDEEALAELALLRTIDKRDRDDGRS